jgi:hypothetical protein
VCGLFGQSSNEHIRVIVLLHSGLPNPGFDITGPQDIVDLKALSRDLPPAEERRWPPLCGFQLFNHGVPQFPQELLLCRGVIRTFQEGTMAYFEDARGLEHWLVKQARKRGINMEAYK